MSKPKFKSIGLDTRNLEYGPLYFDKFEYVVSSIRANNPHETYGILNSCNKDVKLVLITDFLDSLDVSIVGYLSEVQRDYIDLLLVDAKCDIQKYIHYLGVLVESKTVRHIGIINPVSVSQLEKIKITIPDLVYVGLDLCPLNYNKEVLDWCSKNNVQVLGFNQFGGHLSAPSLIESFSAPYLLNFSALYSDIIILSGSNIKNALNNYNYLEELMDFELYEKDYKLDKSVSKLIKPMKKCVHSLLKIEDEGLELPFNDPGELYSPEEISLGFKTQIMKDTGNKQIKPDIIEEIVCKNISEMHRPEDGDYLSFISILRPRILGTLQKYYKEKQNWQLSYFMATDNMYVFSASRKEKRTNYLLYVDDKTWIFRKLKNGD